MPLVFDNNWGNLGLVVAEEKNGKDSAYTAMSLNSFYQNNTCDKELKLSVLDQK